jgi:hypothetical protein
MFPYPVGLGRRGVTGCSEGCVVIQSGLAGMSEMVWWHTTETVEFPLVDLVCLEEQRSPGEQRKAEGLGGLGCPALEARG